MTNHALQILYAPREQKDANEFSEMLGFETVKGKSHSRQLSGKHGKSESTSQQRRALLLPQEIKEIGQQKEIIIFENAKPILCNKIQYYSDAVFKERLLPAPQIATLDIDLHCAKTQKRVRPMTIADIEQLDLNWLDLDYSQLPIPADGNIREEDIPIITEAILKMMGINVSSDNSEEERFIIEKANPSSPKKNSKIKNQQSPILEL
jgi:type IV secretion system protein VirD4